MFLYVVYMCCIYVYTRLLAHTHLFERRASQTISISRSDFIALAKEFAVNGILVQTHKGSVDPLSLLALYIQSFTLTALAFICGIQNQLR